MYSLSLYIFRTQFALSMSQFTFDIMDHGSLGTPINLQPLLLTNARGQTFDGKVCEYTTFIQLSLKHLLCSRQWFESSGDVGARNRAVFIFTSTNQKISQNSSPTPPLPQKNRQKPTGLMMLTGTRICGNWQLTTLKNDDSYHPHMFMESLHGHKVWQPLL